MHDVFDIFFKISAVVVVLLYFVVFYEIFSEVVWPTIAPAIMFVVRLWKRLFPPKPLPPLILKRNNDQDNDNSVG